MPCWRLPQSPRSWFSTHFTRVVRSALKLPEYMPAATRRAIPSPTSFVRYSDSVESVPADEAQTIDAILASTHRLHQRTHAKFGEAVRVSHAKAHGVAVGELIVVDDLPEPLAQGVFKLGARYPVIARLANVPGEIDSDAVATQRGLALKLLEVEGEKLPGHTGATQDFVLDSGNRFAAGTAAQFLMNHRMLEHAPQIPDALKAGRLDGVTCRQQGASLRRASTAPPWTFSATAGCIPWRRPILPRRPFATATTSPSLPSCQ